MKSALKRHGGKSYLQPKIVAKLNEAPHKKFLDAYCGGLNVLLNKPCEGISEWANDTHGEITNFWRVLRDTPDKLLRSLLATPFSQAEFMAAINESGSTTDEIKRAVQFFTLNRMSRQAKGTSYATPTSRQRRGMNEHVSAWWGAIEGLPELHQRLRRVEIWTRPAVGAIKELDSPDFLVYCDPPYMHEVRVTKNDYEEHEMSDKQHEELLNCLAGMQGNFVLSGYHTELYDSYAEMFDWQCIEIKIANSASGAKTKKIETECLWSNY